MKECESFQHASGGPFYHFFILSCGNFGEIFGKDARGALDLGSARTLAIVLGIALVGHKVSGRHGAFKPQEFGADDAAVLSLRAFEQLLHHLVAMGLSFAIGAFCLAIVETCQNDEPADGATHHAHAPHSTAKSGSDELRLLVVKVIEVGKSCHNALAAAVAAHEEIYGTLYAFFVCHISLIFCLLHVGLNSRHAVIGPMTALAQVFRISLVGVCFAFKTDHSIRLHPRLADARSPRRLGKKSHEMPQEFEVIEDEKSDKEPLQLLKEMDVLVPDVIVVQRPFATEDEHATNGDAEERLWREESGTEDNGKFHGKSFSFSNVQRYGLFPKEQQ